MLSCAIHLRLFYHVSTYVSLLIPFIFFCTCSLMSLSSGVSFVPIITTLCHISYSAVIITLNTLHLIFHCTYLPLMLSCVSDAIILINLHISLHYTSLTVLHLCHISTHHHCLHCPKISDTHHPHIARNRAHFPQPY